LSRFMSNVKFINSLFGESVKKPLNSESSSRENARRSIVVKNYIAKGDVINENDITYKRPASGISAIHWDEVVGSRANRDLDLDHILLWSDIC